MSAGLLVKKNNGPEESYDVINFNGFGEKKTAVDIDYGRTDSLNMRLIIQGTVVYYTGLTTIETVNISSSSKDLNITADPESRLFWGDVPWEFDKGSGILTFTSGGELSEEGDSPWKRNDGYRINATDIKKIIFKGKVKTPVMSYALFGHNNQGSDPKSYQLSNLQADVSSFNTSKVTNMRMMFGNNLNLESLNISNFDISLLSKSGCIKKRIDNGEKTYVQ